MMNGETITVTDELDPQLALVAPRPSRLRIFSLYEDFASGIPARWLAGEISLLAKPQRESTTEMWKFDHVARPGAFQKMTAQEAGEADVLIVAAVSVNDAPAGLVDWFEQLTAWRQNRLYPGLLVGLLGIQSEVDVEASVMRNDLQRFAERTGATFLWRPMDVYGEADAKWLVAPVKQFLAARVNAATPLASGTPETILAGT